MEQVCSTQRITTLCAPSQPVGDGPGPGDKCLCAQVAVHMSLSYLQGVWHTNACPWKPFDIG
eukprot:8222277-Lingulodinium_polyedra.AAC.1